MTESIDLTKFNIMTDSMYDTTGTQMSEPKRQMVFTTPFEQQPKYLMRAGNKPFQPSKYPSAGHEWYAKRAANDVDLQTDMEKVLPDQQVQNWGRTKTVILQKEDAKPEVKETAVESQLEKSSNSEISKAFKRIKARQAEKKKKEGYITSPFAETEDTWSSAGRIKDFNEEKFTVAGKDFQVIDVIIVILVIIILIVGIYIYINKQKEKKLADKPEIVEVPDSEPDYDVPEIDDDESNDVESDKNDEPNKNDEPAPIYNPPSLPLDTDNTRTEGGESKVLNCGNLCGGAAFDTKI